MWSNFKHHSTIEFLIITPKEQYHNYASHCAVGRISDKEIVEQSHRINYLLPGDTIISIRWACSYHSSCRCFLSLLQMFISAGCLTFAGNFISHIAE